MQKKVAAIHDISGFGRCSLTTAIATLSACGLQCCPVPSAVLSAHTAYQNVTFRDLTEDLPGFVQSFARLGLSFDALYSGYLGSSRQMSAIRYLQEHCAAPGCFTVVDPVMGDNGKPYTVAQDAGFVEAMRGLCAHATLITPNLTEAAMLLGREPGQVVSDRGAALEDMEALARLGPDCVVVTGLHEGGTVGAGYYQASTGLSGFSFQPEVPAYFPGTGDLFASVLVAAMLGREFGLAQAVETATGFVRDCADYTLKQGTPPIDGVQFELLLGRLIMME